VVMMEPSDNNGSIIFAQQLKPRPRRDRDVEHFVQYETEILSSVRPTYTTPKPFSLLSPSKEGNCAFICFGLLLRKISQKVMIF